MRNRLRVALLLASLPVAAHADDRGPLRFRPGTSSATVESAVVRADREIYRVAAKAGQTMTVRIAAPEDNAVITIYGPGTVASKDADDIWDFSGEALAGDGSEIRNWSGRLPRSGEYLIVVGGTRGNAAYRLTVAIH